MMKHRLAVVAPLLLALLLAACQGGGTGDTQAANADGDSVAGAAGPSGQLVIAFNGLEPRANWALETDDATLLAKLGVMEPLLQVDFDGEVHGGLATSWEQIDELTWAFDLRDDVRFQDGEPVTADAVVTALEHVVATAAPPRSLPPELFAGFEADGDQRLIVRTSEPDAVLPLRFTSPNSGILAPSAYSDGAEPSPFGTGTGPFELVEEVRDQRLVLEANDDYWGGAVPLAEVEVRMVPDGGVRAGMVQSGEADIAYDIPIPQLPVIEALPDVTLVSEELPRTQTLLFNTASDVVGDVRVRQAIMHAIDTQLLSDGVLEGAASPAAGPFPLSQAWANTDLAPFAYDPERAQQLLADAGYEPGELSLTLTTYPERAELPDLAVAIQGMLSEVGITIDTRVIEYAAVEPQLYDGDYEMFLLSRSHLFDMYDPIGYLESDYTCEGGYNLSHYCDEEVDAAVSAAATLPDAEDRWQQYRDASTILHEETISGFLVHSRQLAAVSDRVEGFRLHPLDNRWLTTELSVR